MNLKLNLKKALSLSLVILIGTFLVSSSVRAGTLSDNLGDFVGSFIGLLISGIGLILILVMKGLIIVAQYSNFLGAPAITNGWVAVRDICNMFFVVVLLVIAFATILRIESYNYKKWLPKLILMAILINYSKTICGILIDASQIVMLTFVNAFKDVAGGNLIQMFGISDILTLAQKNDSVGFWAIVGSYMLGLIYIIIALIVVLAMTAMLVMRIVMIWIYVVLSPLAYLLSAFPGGQKYASQWWSEFVKNLIVGPVLAFFIWLSFVAVGTPGAPQGFDTTNGSEVTPTSSGLVVGEGSGFGTKASTADVFIKFIVAIGMLLGGMQITQQIGGAAAGVAGKVFSKGKGIALGAGIGALALARKGAKNAGMAAVNNKGVRGTLDRIGSMSSNKSLGGAFVRAIGLRAAARAGSLALGKHKTEVEEKAKKKVEAYKKAGATRTVQQIASGDAWGMSQKAAQKEARKMAPAFSGGVESFDRARGAVGVDPANLDETEAWLKNMSEKDFQAMDGTVHAKLGKGGIDLNHVPKYRDYLKKSGNAEARGFYNTGQIDAGLHEYVAGVDSRGQELTRRKFGTLTLNGNDRDKLFGRTDDTRYNLSTNYDGEDEEDDYNFEEKMTKQYRQSRSAKSSVNSPEVKAQHDRINSFIKPEDQELVQAEAVRSKISGWNEVDGKDYFNDDHQVQEAIKQVKEEEVSKQAQEQEVAKQAEERRKSPGAGNLSVNTFARGDESNAIAVDFNQLDEATKNELQANLKPGKGLADIRGLNTEDKGAIKNVSASIIKVIDQELATLSSKSETLSKTGETLSKSDEHRKVNLEEAKSKLSQSEKFENISLVNSSALGYAPTDIKRTLVHERTHGLGIKDEALTDAMAKSAVADRQYDVRSGGDKFEKYVEIGMDKIRGQKDSSSKSVKEVLQREEAESNIGGTVNNITNISKVDTKKIQSEILAKGGGSNGRTALETLLAQQQLASLKKINRSIENMADSKSGTVPPVIKVEPSQANQSSGRIANPLPEGPADVAGPGKGPSLGLGLSTEQIKSPGVKKPKA